MMSDGNSTTGESPRYYPFLDGFRALAIMWVLVYHVYHFFGLSVLIPSGFPFMLAFVQRGFLGVDIFFVISGFLITGLLLRDINTKVRIKRFYARRFFKIIPHYLAVVVTGIMITAVAAPHFLSHTQTLLSYFLFYNNYVPAIPILGHLWSIAVEEHFYFLLPLLFAFVCFLQKEPRGRKNLLIFGFMLMIVIVNGLRFVYCPKPAYMGYPAGWIRTHFRFDALVFGCCLKLWENRVTRQPAASDRLLALGAFAGGVVLFAFVAVRFDYQIWYHYTLTYLATGLMFVAALKEFGPLKWIAEQKLFIWIGKNSYGIYLWHMIVLYPFNRWYFRTDMSLAVIIGLYVCAAVFCGFISTRTIEQYFLNMRKRVAP